VALGLGTILLGGVTILGAVAATGSVVAAPAAPYAYVGGTLMVVGGVVQIYESR
jgi:hypothetical protein